MQSYSMKTNIPHIKIFTAILVTVFFSNCTTLSDLQRTSVVTDPVFTEYTGLKRAIAVLNFEDETELGQGKVGSAISDMLIGQLVRSGRFVVVERSQLEQILQEQGLGQTGVMTEETAAQVGKLLGAHALVLGRLNELTFRSGRHDFKSDEEKEEGFSLAASIGMAEVSFKVINTETGEIFISDVFRETDFRPGFGIRTKEWAFEDIEDFNQSVVGIATRKCLNKIVVKIIKNSDQLPWFGKVIKVDTTTIFFSPGKKSGIKVGQYFSVYSAITDIDSAGLPLGKVEVVDFIGERITKASILAGENFAPGNIIRENQNFSVPEE